MDELALFAGAGGGILGGVLVGWRTIAAVEVDPYCREVLLRRQLDGHLSAFPIWDDIKTFRPGEWRGLVDVVSAGFPCQPFSLAGKREGKNDERNLWPDTARVIGEIRPQYAFLENVPGLLNSGYFGTVLGDLAALGYDAEWIVLGADDCGAPHKRKRLWVLAYSNIEPDGGLDARRGWDDSRKSSGSGEVMADSHDSTGCGQSRIEQGRRSQESSGCGQDGKHDLADAEERGLSMRGGEESARSGGHAVREGLQMAEPSGLGMERMRTEWEQVAKYQLARKYLAATVLEIEYLGGTKTRRKWPTPKGTPSGPDFARTNRPGSGGDDTSTAVARETPGSLNPDWVEWLMGWPIGWTDLKPLETDRFLSWRLLHGRS